MIYVSIDLETTGLNPDYCQIIEFGAVVEDTSKNIPIDDLPQFHKYVKHNIIVGEAYALSMHSKIFSELASDKNNFLQPFDVIPSFLGFMAKLGFKPPFNVAGKNFASFDFPFIKLLPNYKKNIFRHRIIDPGSIFARPDDDAIPGTEECFKRAGIEKLVNHTAIEDAKDVIGLLRYAWSQEKF